MKLCMVGTGYVGLVAAACFAEMGNHVVCVDVNPRVVAALTAGKLHIYEPGLEELVRRGAADGRLRFTCDPAEALAGADIAFICVGTPPGEDGSCDAGWHDSDATDRAGQKCGISPLIPHFGVLGPDVSAPASTMGPMLTLT